MIGKKRGPVPKPKGIASGYVNSMNHVSDYGIIDQSACYGIADVFHQKETFVEIVIKIHANQYANSDQIRQAAKKAIELYFKSRHERKK